VENVSSWKISCGGRGDNRKKIRSFISDRVKYITLSPPVQKRLKPAFSAI